MDGPYLAALDWAYLVASREGKAQHAEALASLAVIIRELAKR